VEPNLFTNELAEEWDKLKVIEDGKEEFDKRVIELLAKLRVRQREEDDSESEDGEGNDENGKAKLDRE
jgi:hypothetical protein